MQVGLDCLHGLRSTELLLSTGGIGVIGGVRQSPKMLQDNIDELKSHLDDPNAPFGVDLLIPQVGGNARKTNVGTSGRNNWYRCIPI